MLVKGLPESNARWHGQSEVCYISLCYLRKGSKCGRSCLPDEIAGSAGGHPIVSTGELEVWVMVGVVEFKESPLTVVSSTINRFLSRTDVTIN